MHVLCKVLQSGIADTRFTAVAKLPCAEVWGGDVQWTHLQRVPTADGQRVHRAGGPAPGRADGAGDDGLFCAVPGRWPQERCGYREHREAGAAGIVRGGDTSDLSRLQRDMGTGPNLQVPMYRHVA